MKLQFIGQGTRSQRCWGGLSGRVEEDEAICTSTSVNSMSLAFFQRQLVVHFAIMFTRNLIKWPKNRKAQGIDRDKLFN